MSGGGKNLGFNQFITTTVKHSQTRRFTEINRAQEFHFSGNVSEMTSPARLQEVLHRDYFCGERSIRDHTGEGS